MRTNKNLEVKSKAWKHLFFLCALCMLCGLIGCENHWMKEATAHMHRHSFEWRETIDTGEESIQTLACTTGCNTTRGTRVEMRKGGILNYEGGIITGGQPDEFGKLIIPSMINGVPITGINGSAFLNNKNIEEVEIAYGVTTIGGDVFLNCTNLTKVTIPASVTTIGNSSFSLCSKLNDVTIPEGVKVIEPRAFHYCSALTSIIIPASVVSIGGQAFQFTGLTSVTFNGGSTEIAGGDTSFPDGASLRAAYSSEGAGTYTLTDGEWTRVP